MGGGKCQLCMKESAAIRERTWRGQSRVIRHRAGGEGERGGGEGGRLSTAMARSSGNRR